MTCHKIRRLLSVQREWTAQDRASAEAHLAGCPACQSVAREYELMDRRLGRLPEPLPAAVQARTMKESAPMKKRSASWPRRVLQGAALVAVAALVVVVALVWNGLRPAPASEPGAAPITFPATATMGADIAKTAEPMGTAAPDATSRPAVEVEGSLDIYGVQAHMLSQDPAPVVEAVQELGFGWIKQQVRWDRFEPSQGDYQWAELDALAIPVTAADVEMLWSIVAAPDWARQGQDLSVIGPPNDPQDLADFLGAVAERYCGTGLGAIEVWDEQNLHYKWGNMTIDPVAYMDLLKPAYEAIKVACPAMLVISGGLVPTGAPLPKAMDDGRYLDGMYRFGLKEYADGVGVHLPAYNLPPDADWRTYQDHSARFRGFEQFRHRSWSFQGTAEEYRDVMEANGAGDHPLWVTEFGWAVSDDPPQYWEYAADNTPQEQAEFTLRALEMAKEWGWVKAMFLWNLNFSVIAPDSEKAMWSIVGPEWERSTTFKALVGMENR